MIWIFLTLLFFFITLLGIFYLFIYKFINNRNYSKKNGIELIVRIIKSNKIPVVFILDLRNIRTKTINFIKYHFKYNDLNYFIINDLKKFNSFHYIFNNLYESKFIIFGESISNETYQKYFKPFYKNILIINICYNNSLNNFKTNIKSIKNLVKDLRYYINYLNESIHIVNLSEKLIFNELEYAFDKHLVEKKTINLLEEEDYNNIIIPNEYFLLKDNLKKYLLTKSIFKYVYLTKKVSFYNKILKIIDLNYVFNGINDSYDFNPVSPTKFNFTKNHQLFNFINYSDNLKIFIDDEILLNRDSSLIVNDLKNMFNLTIQIQSSDKIKIADDHKYIIICNKNKKLVIQHNVLIYNIINFKSLLRYIFSKTFELRINTIYDKKLFFNSFGDDLLLINKRNINTLGQLLLNNLIWIQDINKINIIDYLQIISLQKKIFIHILLDNPISKEIFIVLNKFEFKYIIYLKKEIPNFLNLNNITLELSQININNLKEIVLQSKKSLIVYYN